MHRMRAACSVPEGELVCVTGATLLLAARHAKLTSFLATRMNKKPNEDGKDEVLSCVSC